MLRSIGAVLAGYISIAILVVSTDFVIAGFKPGEYRPGQMPPAIYFVISLFTAPLYSVVGGYVCAWLARVCQNRHVLALIVFGEAMGVASAIAFRGQQPVWYGLALLVLYPPAVWLGGRLRVRVQNRNSRAASAA
jgi:hypothetical protein